MSDEQIIIEAWKQAVAVQMHFNDIAMKLRAFALTLVAALVTAQNLSSGRNGIGALVSALVTWFAFYLMDRYWYHSLLVGAVLYGRALEIQAETLNMKFPPRPPGGGIYSASLLGIADYIGQANQQHWRWRVNRKIDTYYFLVAVALLIILLARLQVFG